MEPRYQRLTELGQEWLDQVNAILGAEEDPEKRLQQWTAINEQVRSLAYQVKRIGLPLHYEMPKEGE